MNTPDNYPQYTGRKMAIILLLALATIILALYAVNAGSSAVSPLQVLMAILDRGDATFRIVILNIRLPRIIAGLLAGAGLSVAGCIMQNLLRNPLASPFTLGLSQGAAFGASLAIIIGGAAPIQGAGIVAAIFNSPYLVTIFA